MLARVLTIVTYIIFLIVLIGAGVLYRHFHDIQVAMDAQQDISRVCILDLLETRQRILHNQCIIMKAIIPQDWTSNATCEGIERLE